MLSEEQVRPVLARALNAGEGLLRLPPTRISPSFLHPGKRIKLHRNEYYLYGTHRGGIDERRFANTTDAANEGRRMRPLVLPTFNEGI